MAKKKLGKSFLRKVWKAYKQAFKTHPENQIAFFEEFCKKLRDIIFGNDVVLNEQQPPPEPPPDPEP